MIAPSRVVIALAMVPLASTITPAHAAGAVRFVDAGTGDCLDAYDGVDVISLACNREAGKPEDGWQLWNVEDISRATGVPGTYLIRNDHEKYDDRCLAARGTGSNGVVLAGCTPEDSGQWWIVGNHTIKAYSFKKAGLYDEAGTLDVRIGNPVHPGVNARWCRRTWPTQNATCKA